MKVHRALAADGVQEAIGATLELDTETWPEVKWPLVRQAGPGLNQAYESVGDIIDATLSGDASTTTLLAMLHNIRGAHEMWARNVEAELRRTMDKNAATRDFGEQPSQRLVYVGRQIEKKIEADRKQEMAERAPRGLTYLHFNYEAENQRDQHLASLGAEDGPSVERQEERDPTESTQEEDAKEVVEIDDEGQKSEVADVTASRTRALGRRETKEPKRLYEEIAIEFLSRPSRDSKSKTAKAKSRGSSRSSRDKSAQPKKKKAKTSNPKVKKRRKEVGPEQEQERKAKTKKTSRGGSKKAVRAAEEPESEEVGVHPNLPKQHQHSNIMSCNSLVAQMMTEEGKREIREKYVCVQERKKDDEAKELRLAQGKEEIKRERHQVNLSQVSKVSMSCRSYVTTTKRMRGEMTMIGVQARRNDQGSEEHGSTDHSEDQLQHQQDSVDKGSGASQAPREGVATSEKATASTERVLNSRDVESVRDSPTPITPQYHTNNPRYDTDKQDMELRRLKKGEEEEREKDCGGTSPSEGKPSVGRVTSRNPARKKGWRKNCTVDMPASEGKPSVKGSPLCDLQGASTALDSDSTDGTLRVYVVTEANQCLSAVGWTDGNIRINIILDTGASTTLMGRGLAEKRKAKGLEDLKIEPLPKKFQILGVSSGAPIDCKGITEIPVKFDAEGSERTFRFRALYVPGWDGDLILSWNVLDTMGLNFVRDGNTGKTKAVVLSRAGNLVVPVSARYDVKIAGQARLLTAELDKAVKQNQIDKLKYNIIHGTKATLTIQRRERSERFRLEMRALRKEIGPEAYRLICEEARKARLELKRKGGILGAGGEWKQSNADIESIKQVASARIREDHDGGNAKKVEQVNARKQNQRSGDKEQEGKGSTTETKRRSERDAWSMRREATNSASEQKRADAKTEKQPTSKANGDVQTRKSASSQSSVKTEEKHNAKKTAIVGKRERKMEQCENKKELDRVTDYSGGWEASKELLRQLRERIGWRQKPKVLAKRNADLMPALRKMKDGMVIIPWQDGGSQTLELIDRLVEIPLLIPSTYMVRGNGKPLKDKSWLVAQIDEPEKAEIWRLLHRRYFKNDSNREKLISVMTQLWPAEVRIPERRNWASWELGERLYENVKAAVVIAGEKFSSQELGAEEEEDGILDQVLPLKVEEAARKDIYPTKEAMAKAMNGKVDKRVLEIAWKHRRVFDPVEPGSVKDHVHRIELDTKKELKAKLYPIKPEHEAEVKKEIEKLLEKGMIKEVTQSPYLAPLVIVKKKDASGAKTKIRMCVDYRLLNEHTIPDSYPMPALERLLDVGRAKWFTKMDLSSAFWQVPLSDEDSLKTAFHFLGRTYVWRVLPFGLKNAPPTFQRLGEKVLASLLGRGVFLYIDDILIFTESQEEHLRLLDKVLGRLRDAGLKVSIEKSVWMAKEVTYLGYIIGQGELRMDPAKVRAILDIKTPPERAAENGGRYSPNLRKQIKSFLGAAGFYRKFIKDFATLSAPLTDLTKEGKRPQWTQVHTDAWQELQRRLASAPVLRQPDPERRFFIDTDASNTGVGAVLLQKDDEGNAHPVAYASRKMTSAEMLYSTREQEALAIIFAIEKFNDHIRGRRFTVVTDHRSLSWLMKMPVLKGRLLNWAYRLRSYDFEIVYRRGSENHTADMLSRLHHTKVSEGKNEHLRRLREAVRGASDRVIYARTHEETKATDVNNRRAQKEMESLIPAHPCLPVNAARKKGTESKKTVEAKNSQTQPVAGKRKRGRPPKSSNPNSSSQEEKGGKKVASPKRRRVTRSTTAQEEKEKKAAEAKDGKGDEEHKVRIPAESGNLGDRKEEKTEQNMWKEAAQVDSQDGDIKEWEEVTTLESSGELDRNMDLPDQKRSQRTEPEAKLDEEGKEEKERKEQNEGQEEHKRGEQKQGIELTPEEQDKVAAWELPTRTAWIQKLRDDEDGFGKLVAHLEGREVRYKDYKERKAVEEMAKNFAVFEGILVTRQPYEEEKELRLLCVVPNGFRTQIISENHDTLAAGHRNAETTITYVRKHYWWPGMTEDVKKYVRSCILCAISKAGNGKGVLVGWGIEPPRLTCVHVDYSGPFQTTKRGNRYVFALIDRATGWLELHPTNDCKAETAASILLNQWVPRYGCPRIVVSDNGRHFTAESFEEATRALGMRLRHTTPYHPQSNGMIERRFRDMGRAIRIFGETHGDWDDILPMFVLATRNKVNKSSGYSPATLLYGEDLRLPTAIDSKVAEWQDQPTELQKLIIRRRLVEEVIRQKKLKLFEESQDVARKRFERFDWKVGQQAYYYLDQRTVGQSKKATIRWTGPYEVVEVRDMTLVLLRDGRRITVSQSKCISLRNPDIPDRDMRGRALDKLATDHKLQDAITKEKVAKLAKKLKAKGRRKVAESDSEEDELDEILEKAEPPEEIRRRQLAQRRPEKKYEYKLTDLKENSTITIIWTFGTTRLSKFMFWRRVEGDKEPWLRFHLYGSEQKLAEKSRRYLPTWKSGTRDVLAQMKKGNYSPFWVDIYLDDVIYILKYPLKSGRIDDRDLQAMGYGTEMQVFAARKADSISAQPSLQ